MKVLALLSGFAGLLALSGVAARAEVPVDLELVLAVDVSGSVNEEDAHLQRNGYARAINDRRVVEAIQGGALGRIAVTGARTALDAGAAPDNRLDTEQLRRLDRELLRDALHVVKDFRDHVRRAFHLAD